MAFFKLGKGNDSSLQGAAPVDGIDAVRKKAKQRLMGSAVLVAVAVIGLPILFDSQPRPVPVDIAIEIPDKNKTQPLVLPSAPPLRAPAPAASQPGLSEPLDGPAQKAPQAAASAVPAQLTPRAEKPPVKVAASASLDGKEELLQGTSPPAQAKVPPASVPVVRADDGARARALLEGKPIAKTQEAALTGRFVVQVGAFADELKAREVRLKLEKAGFKTYTHVAETPEGKRTRVRVGPFDNKADAQRAAEKIKGLDLPGAVLSL